MKQIQMIAGGLSKQGLPGYLSVESCKEVQQYHQSMDVYEPTPLVSLKQLAKHLGVKAVYVKDESHRFGLNAFKGMGCTYAIEKTMRETGDKEPVLVTATDGNHGRAVAWAAARAGGSAYVFMPKGSTKSRVNAIAAIPRAKMEVLDKNYDESVAHAFAFAQEHGYYTIQDTGFAGYEKVPTWIAQGYTTLATEAIGQMQAQGTKRPTHVFLQAGVGTFAGAIAGYFAHHYGERLPHITVVEATESACIYRSIEAGDGKPHSIGGNPQTIMAGLNCGTPNLFIWPLLRDFAAMFASCPDWVSEEGMRMLAKPLGDDAGIVSGESGAVGLGLLQALCTMDEYERYKEQMQLDEDSEILLFSTEGDTDPENYQKIVGSGKE